jgi:hypothetical protein
MPVQPRNISCVRQARGSALSDPRPATRTQRSVREFPGYRGFRCRSDNHPAFALPALVLSSCASVAVVAVDHRPAHRATQKVSTVTGRPSHHATGMPGGRGPSCRSRGSHPRGFAPASGDRAQRGYRSHPDGTIGSIARPPWPTPAQLENQEVALFTCSVRYHATRPLRLVPQ